MAVAALLLGAPAIGEEAAPNPGNWLDVRRGGVPAMVAQARKLSAPKVWQATFAGALPKWHPLAKFGAELRMTVARGPADAKARGGDVLVRFEAPPALLGTAVVSHDGKAWIKASGGKPQEATAELLAQPLPGLGLPLLAFVPLDIYGLYAPELEGEFGDVAILRCKPEYAAGPNTPLVKAGVSKRFGVWSLGEVNDRKGKTIALVEWLELQPQSGVAVPQAVRLQGADLHAQVVTLRRTELTVGKAMLFGPKLLK